MVTIGSVARRLARRARVVRGPLPNVCHNLGDWAAGQPDADRIVLDPSFVAMRPMPVTIDEAVHPSFAPLTQFDVAARTVVRVPNARLGTDIGLVVLPDGSFVGELFAQTPEGQRKVLRAQPGYRTPVPVDPPRLAGDYVAFLGLGWNHYYHWIHDFVMGARGIGEWLPPDTQVIVPASLAPFQVATLALLDVGRGRRPIPFAAHRWVELENLFVVTPRLKTQADSAAPYEWFHAAMASRYGITRHAPERRLLLSRRDDDHWRTTNEAEVEAALEPLGFTTVSPARLSFRHQMELFSRAEVIVGTGAGLFNMVFSPASAKVLQFQDPTHVVHALWTEAGALGLPYGYVMCERMANTESHLGDLRVPVKQLLALLRAMGVD